MSFMGVPITEHYGFPWDLEPIRRSLYMADFTSNYEPDGIEALDKEFKRLRFHLRENYHGFTSTFRHFNRFLKKVKKRENEEKSFCFFSTF